MPPTVCPGCRGASFGIQDLRMNDYIKSSKSFFGPAGAMTDEERLAELRKIAPKGLRTAALFGATPIPDDFVARAQAVGASQVDLRASILTEAQVVSPQQAQTPRRRPHYNNRNRAEAACARPRPT